MHGEFFFFFSILLLSRLLLLNLTLAKIIKHGDARRSFLQYYMYRTFKTVPDKLCDMNKETKIDLCNAVMNDKDFFDDFLMYLNKVGISRNKHSYNCKAHHVQLYLGTDEEYKTVPVPYQMFPCFGRHDPVRSRWDLDDYYNVLFLAGGPTPDSIYIFIRYIFPRSDLDTLYGIITDIPVDNLPKVSFSERELAYELKSLNILSYNGNAVEIETLFIRNVLLESAQIPDTLCHFRVEQKMELCDTILSSSIYRDVGWELNEAAFRNFKSECVLNSIHFVYFPMYHDNTLIQQQMIPCYGIPENSHNPHNNEDSNMLTLFYLYAGFRDNSILVFAKYSETTFSIREFIENINLDDISGKDYLNNGGQGVSPNNPPVIDDGDSGNILFIDSDDRESNNARKHKINSHEVDTDGIKDNFNK